MKGNPYYQCSQLVPFSYLSNVILFLAAPDETNSIRILKNGISQNHSPSDTSLITCVALTKDCQIIAYGCSNGSVRLYFPASKSVKMLGTHSTKVLMNFTIHVGCPKPLGQFLSFYKSACENE